MANRNKLGAAMQAAKAGQSGPKRSVGPEVETSLSEDVGTADEQPSSVTLRIPTLKLKRHWQQQAFNDRTTLTEAIIGALTERWGTPDD